MRTICHGTGGRKGRCRGPGAAGGVHLQCPLGQEALAILGDTGGTGFTASWWGGEVLGQAGHFHRIPGCFGLEEP